jgi:hypothetical protein
MVIVYFPACNAQSLMLPSIICSLLSEQDLFTSASAVEFITPNFPHPIPVESAAKVGKSCPLCEVSILCAHSLRIAYAYV